MKEICQRFSGSTKSLTSLRQKLNVKDFTQVLNSFPSLRKRQLIGDMKKSAEDVNAELSGIMIHFERCDSEISLETSAENSEASMESSEAFYSSEASEISLTEKSGVSSMESIEVSSVRSSVTSISHHEYPKYQSLDLITESTSESERSDDKFDSSPLETSKFCVKKDSLTHLQSSRRNSQPQVEKCEEENNDSKSHEDVSSENLKKKEPAKFHKILNSQNLLLISVVILSTLLVARFSTFKLK